MTAIRPASLEGWHPEDVVALRDPAVLANLGVDSPHRYDATPVGIREDNNRRAGWALIGFNAYSEHVHKDSGEDLATGLGDLLGDLLHLCDLLGLDFSELEDRARGHYLAELAGVL